jgi:transcriptional regulator with XRE-family HTH domain
MKSKQSKDFNKIKQWLVPQLRAKGMNVEKFAREADIWKTSVYNYMNDTNRPDTETMAKMCRVLGKPLEEGLAQYTPRQEGRPEGYTPGAAELRVPKTRR